jgi:hypothetical protein
MAWVLHSDTKEALLDACLPDPPSWPAMKALGVGFWHTNVTDLRARIEKAARAQFMEKKDPKDCALLYLALDRKVRMAGGVRKQEACNADLRFGIFKLGNLQTNDLQIRAIFKLGDLQSGRSSKWAIFKLSDLQTAIFKMGDLQSGRSTNW